MVKLTGQAAGRAHPALRDDRRHLPQPPSRPDGAREPRRSRGDGARGGLRSRHRLRRRRRPHRRGRRQGPRDLGRPADGAARRRRARRPPGATIIADVKASQVLFDEIARMGGKPLMWQTGHSLIKTKMKEIKAPLAGEMSGHIFFADRYYGYDDALYAAVRLISIVSRASEGLDKLRDRLPNVVNTPELRFPCEEERKFAVVDEVKARLEAAGADVNDIDGVRVTTADGWWLLRASNTQDVLVARCEARDAAGLERLKTLLARPGQGERHRAARLLGGRGRRPRGDARFLRLRYLARRRGARRRARPRRIGRAAGRGDARRLSAGAGHRTELSRAHRRSARPSRGRARDGHRGRRGGAAQLFRGTGIPGAAPADRADRWRRGRRLAVRAGAPPALRAGSATQAGPVGSGGLAAPAQGRLHARAAPRHGVGTEGDDHGAAPGLAGARAPVRQKRRVAAVAGAGRALRSRRRSIRYFFLGAAEATTGL